MLHSTRRQRGKFRSLNRLDADTQAKTQSEIATWGIDHALCCILKFSHVTSPSLPLVKLPLPSLGVYAIAAGAAAATLYLRILAAPWFGERPVLILFVLPILLGAYLGGLKPGLIATVVVVLGVHYYLIEPKYGLLTNNRADIVDMIVLGMVGVFSSLLMESLRDALTRNSAERDRANAANTQLAAIVESSFDAIIGKTLDGIVTSWNASAERVFGYSADEMVGNSIKLLIPDDSLKEEERVLGRIKRGGHAENFVTIRRRKDGELIDVSVTISPIKDSKGTIIGASKVARDITESKRAEQRRLLSEARYRSLFENAPDGILIADSKSRYIDANASVCRMLGYAREEFIGLHASDIVVETEVQNIEPALGAIKAKSDYHRQWEFRRKDGTTFAGEVIATMMPDGNLLGMIRDITERKEAAMAISDSEERFRMLANSIPQLAWIALRDGHIFWYNRRWYEYTGTRPEEMEGGGWQSVLDPRFLPNVLEHWKTAIDSGIAFEMEFPLRSADGRYRAFLTRVEPMKDPDGRVVQWFGTNTDVETLKQSEEKVQTLNLALERRVTERTAELEIANKELEAFSYSVSHDLRAPLRAVNGFAGMVIEQFGLQVPAEAKRYLERIRHNALSMGQLIDDLLAFSRLSRQPLNRREVNMTKLVQNVVDDLAPEREGRQIDIRTGALPDCWGDPALLKQVWVNLLSNAVKYTQGRESALVETGCESSNGEDIYYVRDNGAGFNMKFAHKLFGVFQRLHHAEDFEGTGVGLAIVQRIVHRHGGRVWADAEEGNGAIFRFTLGERTEK